MLTVYNYFAFKCYGINIKEAFRWNYSICSLLADWRLQGKNDFEEPEQLPRQELCMSQSITNPILHDNMSHSLFNPEQAGELDW